LLCIAKVTGGAPNKLSKIMVAMLSIAQVIWLWFLISRRLHWGCIWSFYKKKILWTFLQKIILH
jgi:hypothetical protein